MSLRDYLSNAWLPISGSELPSSSEDDLIPMTFSIGEEVVGLSHFEIRVSLCRPFLGNMLERY